jgi:hypothetical protein
MPEFAVGEMARNKFVVLSRTTAGSPWRAICHTHAQINAKMIADALTETQANREQPHARG